MIRLVAILAALLHLAYSAMLVVVGAGGVALARWELATIFAFDTASLGAVGSATMLNQYRFLKSIELGAGIFCLLFRRGILAGRPEAFAFLALVAGGLIARTLAWIVDGRPAALFLVFLAGEILTFIFVALNLRLAKVGVQR